jgi:hypothetical protein
MKTIFLRACLSLVALAFCLLIFETNARKGFANPLDNQRLAELNARITTLSESSASGDTANPEIAELAAIRFDQLSKLARTDPSDVASVMLPQNVLSKVPSDLQNYFEKSDEVEGELEIMAECEETTDRILYYLDTDQGRIELKFTKSLDRQLRTGFHLRATGMRIGDMLVVSDTSSIETESVSSALPNTTGEHKALVILVNFQDEQTQPYTVDHVRDVAFTQANNYFREASYGQTWLTGDVYGWFTIPMSSTNCDINLISTYAQQAAANAGANLSAYNHFVFTFPNNTGCPFSGYASIGMGNITPKVWINENYSLMSLAHELGHNLGLDHSHAMDCGSVVIGGTCSTSEYGDTFDSIGAGTSDHYNLDQKERLGWTQAQTVTASGTYHIDAFETAGGIKGLKVLRSIDPVTGAATWFYLEHRTAYGFHSGLFNNLNVMNGVLIRLGTDQNSNSSYLLDMTPLTTSWYDPALIVGQTFSDPTGAVTITTLSADQTGAVVNIVVAPQPCVRANPTVTFSPSQGPSVPAGSTVGFSLAITNNDSFACGPSAFNLQAALPANWSAVFADPTPMISPGATGTTNLQITSPVGGSGGLYPVNVTATNNSAPASAASAVLTYSLASSLAETVASTQTSYTRSQTAKVNATITAGGVAVAGATVTFTMTKSNGAVVTSTGTSGTNGMATFTYTLNKKRDPTGAYQVRAQAVANGMSAVGNTGFSVR